MTEEFNPYASPEAQTRGGPPPSEGSGVWRHGKLLVMEHGATLPYRCVKSNGPADGLLRRKMYWHHPAIYLSILAGLLVYVILALVLRKKADVQVPLSRRWFGKRRFRLATAWLGSIGSLTWAVLAVQDVVPIAGLGFGLLGLFVFLVYAALAPRMVVPHRITDQLVWLRGVGRNYLDGLEEFPHG